MGYWGHASSFGAYILLCLDAPSWLSIRFHTIGDGFTFANALLSEILNCRSKRTMLKWNEHTLSKRIEHFWRYCNLFSASLYQPIQAFPAVMKT